MHAADCRVLDMQVTASKCEYLQLLSQIPLGSHDTNQLHFRADATVSQECSRS